MAGSSEKGDSVVKAIVIGVATAVITALVLAVLGLRDSGGPAVSTSGFVPSTPNFNTPAYSTPVYSAQYCMTATLFCPLVQVLPPSTSCYCATAMGNIPGMTQ